MAERKIDGQILKRKKKESKKVTSKTNVKTKG